MGCAYWFYDGLLALVSEEFDARKDVARTHHRGDERIHFDGGFDSANIEDQLARLLQLASSTVVARQRPKNRPSP